MTKLFDRRQLLRGFGFGLLAVPFVSAACTDAAQSSVDSGSGTDSPSSAGPWATGGTVSMTGKSSYPDPFATAAASCALVTAVTEGPCTTTSNLDREDVSEGQTGLPMRLGIRVVDSSCAPIAGAVVKIWHTNLEGSYSGQTPNNGMCLKNQSYASANFMRGVRTTNADGIIYFDSCFPGWYSGRAIHIHFQVSKGGTTYKISQLFFPEALIADIFSSHTEYKGYGQPNTSLASDNVASGIAAASRANHIVEWVRTSDGALLASKTVTVA